MGISHEEIAYAGAYTGDQGLRNVNAGGYKLSIGYDRKHESISLHRLRHLNDIVPDLTKFELSVGLRE